MSAWDSQMFAVDSFGPFIGVFYQGPHLRHTFIYVRLGSTLQKTLEAQRARWLAAFRGEPSRESALARAQRSSLSQA